jgi:hypothetical protein
MPENRRWFHYLGMQTRNGPPHPASGKLRHNNPEDVKLFRELAEILVR